ncbi:unnamed protein product [Brassicogethes aeneus]|uniref:Major facilitator superfamily (MFS) profile domain-containing protein n=1 Tax=Brassicogethes aeneus TaxID=1431903 RepID=A0A9P0ATD5_BRAAE|nr:unnamed protein product [Brassicogethes aeneus]
METIGASCLSLKIVDNNGQPENDNLLGGSTLTLSSHEKKTFNGRWPQICASLFAASFHIGNGISLAYSAVLISQLDKGTDENLRPSTTQKSWIASVLIIVIPVASAICGLLMDSIGRLNTIKIAGLPGIIGWIMIALANNIPVIIVGRLLIGISSAWGTSPGIVYITEIASTDIRGTLMSITPVYVSLGMCLTYFLGWIMDWRTLAWICNVFVVVPCLLCFLIPESPTWLIWKRKDESAKKALKYFCKNQPELDNRSYADVQFEQLKREQDLKRKEQDSSNSIRKFKEFLKPTGYKPLLFFVGIFLFQHFSGIFITMFYSIQFIEAAGTSIDPYIASILIGFVRLIMSLVSTALLSKFNRRSLIFCSTIGMSICMFLSGLFTKWIQDKTTTYTWVPVACILLYVVFSIVGLLPIPNMLLAELFPLEIRGMGYNIGYIIFSMFMFSALQSYFTLLSFFGGATHLQWFFSVISLGGLVYSFIFLPETFNVKLADITKYYEHRTMHIGHQEANKNESNSNNNKIVI